MYREELLSALRRVQPALAGASSLIPVLTHLCFCDGQVSAYNDSVALRCDCDLELEGAVPGAQLLAVLSSSSAADVECQQDDGQALFKLGRSKLKLAVLPTSDFVFVPPKIRGIELDLDVKLREAVKIVSRSATLNLMHPTLSGITLVFGEKKLTLFGTDNVSVARVVENHRVSKLSGKSFVLPPRFYELLLGIGANTKIVFTTGGDVIGVSDEAQLFGKLIGDPEPDRYEKMILSSKLDEIPKADVPASLARCLQRSLIASQKEDVEFSYADGRLNLLAKDQGIEIRDSVKIDLGEEPIKVYTCAEYVLRYLDVAKRIGISDRCIVLEGDNFQVLVGVKAEG